MRRREAKGFQFEDLQTEPWMAEGGCVRDRHPDDWFPHPGDVEMNRCGRVFGICAACPVRADCLEYALSFPGIPLWGIWGGTTMEERKPEVRRRAVNFHSGAKYANR